MSDTLECDVFSICTRHPLRCCCYCLPQRLLLSLSIPSIIGFKRKMSLDPNCSFPWLLLLSQHCRCLAGPQHLSWLGLSWRAACCDDMCHGTAAGPWRGPWCGGCSRGDAGRLQRWVAGPTGPTLYDWLPADLLKLPCWGMQAAMANSASRLSLVEHSLRRSKAAPVLQPNHAAGNLVRMLADIVIM